jgi:hypothetical protein
MTLGQALLGAPVGAAVGMLTATIFDASRGRERRWSEPRASAIGIAPTLRLDRTNATVGVGGTF